MVMAHFIAMLNITGGIVLGTPAAGAWGKAPLIANEEVSCGGGK